MTLKAQLEAAGISQSDVREATGLSKSAVSRIVNAGTYPARGAAMYQSAITELLETAATKNKTPSTLHAEGLSKAAPHSAAISPAPCGAEVSTTKPTTAPTEEVDMLLAKQNITQEAIKHFSLPPTRDPFLDDMESTEDVFKTPDIRAVRQAMIDNVKNGGLLGVVGESGSGKSTLKQDLIERIEAESISAIVVEPYVLAMEENDTKGKTLKAAHIAEALISRIDPRAKPKRSPEARFAQLHQLLKDSRKAGNRHVLIIEEAHCLPTATLKHLKRFIELQDGFKRLLSIILIGQPELRHKLSEKNQEVREVVQRCFVVELPPLNQHVGDYLKFKFKRIGVDVATVISPDGISAIEQRLGYQPTGNTRSMKRETQSSWLYPLAVGNLVVACINTAASLGVPLVTADVAKGI
jgi:type II secretory pathway predicted ATPase ExeA